MTDRMLKERKRHRDRLTILSRSGVRRRLLRLANLLQGRCNRLFRRKRALSDNPPSPFPEDDSPEVHVYILPYTNVEVVLQPLYPYITLSQQLKCRVRITEGTRQIPAGCIAEFRLEHAGKLRYRAYLSMLSASSRTTTFFYWLFLRQDAAAFLPPYQNRKA